MSFRLSIAAAAVVIAAPGIAGAQVLLEKNVSAKMALTIAETAFASISAHANAPATERNRSVTAIAPHTNAAHLAVATETIHTCPALGILSSGALITAEAHDSSTAIRREAVQRYTRTAAAQN